MSRRKRQREDWRKISSFIPTPDRSRIAAELKRAYEAGHTTSGRVIVKSLAFSSDPRKWKIIATPSEGEDYTAPATDAQGVITYKSFCTAFRRTDVCIDAVLSPEWLRKPRDHFILRQEDNRIHEIIAGTRELEAPKDADRLELLCVTHTHGSLATKTCYAFRYTKGPVVVTVGEGLMTTLSQLRIALPIAHKQFHQTIAAQVAARLNPKPVVRSDSPAEWARRQMARSQGARIQQAIAAFGLSADEAAKRIIQLSKTLGAP